MMTPLVPDHDLLRHSRMTLARIAGIRIDPAAVAAGLGAAVGAGTLGSNLVPAAAAVGHSVDVYDFDRVGPETLGRSIAFAPSAIGRRKAEALAAAGRRLNPAVRGRGFVADARLTVGGARWARYDVVYLLTDNLRSRAEIASLALRNPGGPLLVVEAGLAGFDWSVSVMGPGTACYACGLDEGFADVRRSCNGITLDDAGEVMPTTLPAAMSTAGIILQEALVALSGGTPTLYGREVRAVAGARAFSLVEMTLRRSCAGHTRLAEADVLRLSWTPTRAVGEIRGSVAAMLGVSSDDVDLRAPREIVTRVRCTGCATVARFRPGYRELFRASVCACGETVANTAGCACGRPDPAAPEFPYRRLSCRSCGMLDPNGFALTCGTAILGDARTTSAAGLADEEWITAYVGQSAVPVLLESPETAAARIARGARVSGGV